MSVQVCLIDITLAADDEKHKEQCVCACVPGTKPLSCLKRSAISGTCWWCPALDRVRMICMMSLSIRLQSALSASSIVWQRERGVWVWEAGRKKREERRIWGKKQKEWRVVEKKEGLKRSKREEEVQRWVIKKITICSIQTCIIISTVLNTA